VTKKKLKSKTRKKIEQEILLSLKKFGENLTFDDLVTITTGLYGAYALKHPFGFLWGSIGYNLAKAPNILSAASGLAVLGILGLAGLPSEIYESITYEGFIPGVPMRPEWWPFKYPEGWPKYR